MAQSTRAIYTRRDRRLAKQSGFRRPGRAKMGEFSGHGGGIGSRRVFVHSKPKKVKTGRVPVASTRGSSPFADCMDADSLSLWLAFADELSP